MNEEFELEEELEVNMLSVIAHVIGFISEGEGKAPLPAENARYADLLMMNWIVSNTTDEDIIWNFDSSDFYDLALLQRKRESWEVIWEFEHGENSRHEPVAVTVPHKGTFSIPSSIDNGVAETISDTSDTDERIEESPPIVPLKEIIEQYGIDADVDLAVQFELRAEEFPQLTIIPLWR